MTQLIQNERNSAIVQIPEGERQNSGVISSRFMAKF